MRQDGNTHERVPTRKVLTKASTASKETHTTDGNKQKESDTRANGNTHTKDVRVVAVITAGAVTAGRG